MPEQYYYCAAMANGAPNDGGGRKVYSLIDIMRYVLVVLYCGRSAGRPSDRPPFERRQAAHAK